MATIQARNFLLRYPVLSDSQAHFDTQQDEETDMNFMSHPTTVEQARQEIKEAIRDNHKWFFATAEHFVIEVGGKFAGMIALHHFRKGPEGRICSITYNLGERFRGKGIVKEAVRLLCDRAFQVHGMDAVEADVRAYNKPSIAILHKNGFVLKETRYGAVMKRGQQYDDLVYLKTK